MIISDAAARPLLLDLFCGEGGAAAGYHAAGFDVVGVDRDRARLSRYPFDSIEGDALEVLADLPSWLRGRVAAVHASPTCTGYCRGTVAVPDRLDRYDRLIAATRDLLVQTGLPYVIENVADARPELRNPVMLCGRMFGLGTLDDDGTPLVLDRHWLFESNVALLAPEHLAHDRRLQVAGSYAGARRDKAEARNVRRGGYVPSANVQRALLRVPWMSERGCQLSIPPLFTEHIGEHVIHALRAAPAVGA